MLVSTDTLSAKQSLLESHTRKLKALQNDVEYQRPYLRDEYEQRLWHVQHCPGVPDFVKLYYGMHRNMFNFERHIHRLKVCQYKNITDKHAQELQAMIEHQNQALNLPLHFCDAVQVPENLSQIRLSVEETLSKYRTHVDTMREKVEDYFRQLPQLKLRDEYKVYELMYSNVCKCPACVQQDTILCRFVIQQPKINQNLPVWEAENHTDLKQEEFELGPVKKIFVSSTLVRQTMEGEERLGRRIVRRKVFITPEVPIFEQEVMTAIPGQFRIQFPVGTVDPLAVSWTTWVKYITCCDRSQVFFEHHSFENKLVVVFRKAGPWRKAEDVVNVHYPVALLHGVPPVVAHYVLENVTEVEFPEERHADFSNDILSSANVQKKEKQKQRLETSFIQEIKTVERKGDKTVTTLQRATQKKVLQFECTILSRKFDWLRSHWNMHQKRLFDQTSVLRSWLSALKHEEVEKLSQKEKELQRLKCVLLSLECEMIQAEMYDLAETIHNFQARERNKVVDSDTIDWRHALSVGLVTGQSVDMGMLVLPGGGQVSLPKTWRKNTPKPIVEILEGSRKAFPGLNKINLHSHRLSVAELRLKHELLMNKISVFRRLL